MRFISLMYRFCPLCSVAPLCFHFWVYFKTWNVLMCKMNQKFKNKNTWGKPDTLLLIQIMNLLWLSSQVEHILFGMEASCLVCESFTVCWQSSYCLASFFFNLTWGVISLQVLQVLFMKSSLSSLLKGIRQIAALQYMLVLILHDLHQSSTSPVFFESYGIGLVYCPRRPQAHFKVSSDLIVLILLAVHSSNHLTSVHWIVKGSVSFTV